ncbi:sensor histidine kinase [Sphaerisporangium sp. NPDC051011]|uniref:sensor histidine kinase n=1 Tax=Sphaerisporangium sp. NPDC051011 TaxID=3155792 RepID=UPI003406A017
MTDRDSRPLFPRRPRLVYWVAVDAVAALLLAVAFGFAASARTGPPVLALPAVAVAALPVAARRSWPVPMLAISLAGAAAGLLMGVEALYIPVAVILYAVGSLEPRRRAIACLVPSLAGVAAAMASAGGFAWPGGLSEIAFCWLLMGLAWTAGLTVREQRLHAVRAAEQLAARAVTGERLRIARDLHDVIGHSMSLITLKAGVAGMVAEARPQEAREALRVIEATGRTAMAEVRAALGMLRSGEIDPTPGVSGVAETAPAPGLRDLRALAVRADVEVDLTVNLDVEPSEGVALAAYRIVQEALTNVVKHAGAARCRVRITSPEPGVMEVEVADEGPGLPTAGGGYGLIGMRERCLMYGGSLTAGPRPEGGYRVLARLPCVRRAAS